MILQDDDDFLKDLVKRKRSKKRKRFTFRKDYQIPGNMQSVIDYFKKKE